VVGSLNTSSLDLLIPTLIYRYFIILHVHSTWSLEAEKSGKTRKNSSSTPLRRNDTYPSSSQINLTEEADDDAVGTGTGGDIENAGEPK